MSPTATDIARATLLRLSELGLPPTPENYSRFYLEFSGKELPPLDALEPDRGRQAELIETLKSLIESLTRKTSGLAQDLDQGGQKIRQTVGALQQEEEKGEILQLLQAVIAATSSIHGKVENAHEDILASQLTLHHIRAEMQETRQWLQEDALTGAQNRRGMETILAREVARTKRSGCALTVALLDIDHFKTVNDNYGHDAGDKLLSHLSMVIKSVLRESDELVRYGGEEFLLTLPDCNLQGTQFMLDRLKLMVQNSPLVYEGKRIEVTFSGGVAQLLPEENGHALIVRADSALYQAKQAGRNRFQVAAG